MHHFTKSTGSIRNTRTLGFFLAALLCPLSLNLALANEHRRPVQVTATSGHVEVVHQVPGGTIVVGVDFGRTAHRDRDVTIIREIPRNEVTVVKTVRHGRCGKKVTVIETYERHDKHRHHRDSYASR